MNRPNGTGAGQNYPRSMVTMNTPSAVADHIQWMRARNLAPSTIHARWAALMALRSACGDPLHATAETIIGVFDARGLAPSTRNVWRSHLSAFYTWAIDEELIAKSPMRRVPRVEQPENLPRPIGEHALVVAIDEADHRMRAWLTLAAYAGLRVSEIAMLAGENVDLEHSTIRVVMGKRRKSRVVPMHPKVADALAPYLRPGRLWPNPPKVVGMFMNRHLHHHGIADTAHSLRHRFATAIYDQTGDINLVRELLGHASTATTQVYARVSVTRMQAAVSLIA